MAADYPDLIFVLVATLAATPFALWRATNLMPQNHCSHMGKVIGGASNITVWLLIILLISALLGSWPVYRFLTGPDLRSGALIGGIGLLSALLLRDVVTGLLANPSERLRRIWRISPCCMLETAFVGVFFLKVPVDVSMPPVGLAVIESLISSALFDPFGLDRAVDLLPEMMLSIGLAWIPLRLLSASTELPIAARTIRVCCLIFTVSVLGPSLPDLTTHQRLSDIDAVGTAAVNVSPSASESLDTLEITRLAADTLAIEIPRMPSAGYLVISYESRRALGAGETGPTPTRIHYLTKHPIRVSPLSRVIVSFPEAVSNCLPPEIAVTCGPGPMEFEVKAALYRYANGTTQNRVLSGNTREGLWAPAAFDISEPVFSRTKIIGADVE